MNLACNFIKCSKKKETYKSLGVKSGLNHSEQSRNQNMTIKLEMQTL